MQGKGDRETEQVEARSFAWKCYLRVFLCYKTLETCAHFVPFHMNHPISAEMLQLRTQLLALSVRALGDLLQGWGSCECCPTGSSCSPVAGVQQSHLKTALEKHWCKTCASPTRGYRAIQGLVLQSTVEGATGNSSTWSVHVPFGPIYPSTFWHRHWMFVFILVLPWTERNFQPFSPSIKVSVTQYISH